MSAQSAVVSDLTFEQLNLIARRYGAFSGKPLLDVGCGDGRLTQMLHQRGARIQGLHDRGYTESSPIVSLGSPAASIPFPAQSFRTVLVRGCQTFLPGADHAETTIALANLLSCLNVRGLLVIPVADPEACLPHWVRRLEPFPLTVRTRKLSGGLRSILTLARLFGRDARVSVIEFRLDARPMSRLEWHRSAREAVLGRQQPTAA